jgi:hypothetical protein
LTSVTGSILPTFQIYPNPTSGRFEISSLMNIKHAEIFSVTGSIILSTDVNSKKAGLDITMASEGIFLDLHLKMNQKLSKS